MKPTPAVGVMRSSGREAVFEEDGDSSAITFYEYNLLFKIPAVMVFIILSPIYYVRAVINILRGGR